MKLPYNRPWLMELVDHPSCPPSLREGVQNMLTYLWTHRIPPFQWQAPYVLASDVLERVLEEMEEEDRQAGPSPDPGLSSAVEKGERAGAGAGPKERVKVVDFCSGAGGPVGHVERRINQKRIAHSLPTTQFLLSDLHPPLSTWRRLYGPPSSALPYSSAPVPAPYATALQGMDISYIPESVDATNTSSTRLLNPASGSISYGSTAQSPRSNREAEARGPQGQGRHLRTFFLSFHHFNDTDARGVLVDAMRNAEGIAIFELQSADLGSLIMIAMLGPLSWLLTPFTRPTIATLFFTYIIPLIPLLLIIDGAISVYRTRPTSHILHLANLASLSLQLEGEDKGDEWEWEYGSERHTWPFGRMSWVVGRRRGEEGDGEDFGEDMMA